MIIYTGNKLTTEFAKFLRIENSGRGDFNLLIEANEVTAYRYICDEPGGMRARADLIVLCKRFIIIHSF